MDTFFIESFMSLAHVNYMNNVYVNVVFPTMYNRRIQ